MWFRPFEREARRIDRDESSMGSRRAVMVTACGTSAHRDDVTLGAAGGHALQGSDLVDLTDGLEGKSVIGAGDNRRDISDLRKKGFRR